MRLAVMGFAVLALAGCGEGGATQTRNAAFESCRALITEQAQWGVGRMDEVDPSTPQAILPKGEDRHVFQWAVGELTLNNGYGTGVPFNGTCDTEVVNFERRVRINLQSPQGAMRCERWEPARLSRDRASRAQSQEFDRLLGRESCA